MIAFAEQAIETITVFGTSGFTAPGGGMNLQLGAGITLIWIAGLVVWAARDARIRRADEAAEPRERGRATEALSPPPASIIAPRTTVPPRAHRRPGRHLMTSLDRAVGAGRRK